jgi:hypothetical protein
MNFSKFLEITPKKVEELLSKSRPGKWHVYEGCIIYSAFNGVRNKFHIARKLREDDADFIAAAPEIARSYLKLCEEVLRLEALIDKQKKAHIEYLEELQGV